MHRLSLLLFIFFPLISLANEYPKHMVQITTHGLGVGAAFERTYPRDESNFRKFDVFKGEIDFNYAYTLTHRLQLGFLFSNRNEKRNFETKDDDRGRVAYYNLLLGLSLILNFSDDLMNSYYSGLTFSALNHEEEYTKTVFDYLEDDKNAETYEIFFGKRWSLKHWGLANITYSPTLSFYMQRARKDYEDDGLQDNMALNFEVVKFDVLF